MALDSDARGVLDHTFAEVGAARKQFRYELTSAEVGKVRRLMGGVARVSGIPGVGFEEVVEFDNGAIGLVMDLDVDDAGVMLLDDTEGIHAGSVVRRTNRVMDTVVGAVRCARGIVGPSSVNLPPSATGLRCRHRCRPGSR
jgi:F-type H+-transporting ATPase subunit alpha